jgi:hypothetical protein
VIHERRYAKSNAEDCDDEKQANYGLFDLYYRVHAKKCDETHKKPKADCPRSLSPDASPFLRHSGAQLGTPSFLSLGFFQKLRQLRDIVRDPPRLSSGGAVYHLLNEFNRALRRQVGCWRGNRVSEADTWKIDVNI